MLDLYFYEVLRNKKKPSIKTKQHLCLMVPSAVTLTPPASHPTQSVTPRAMSEVSGRAGKGVVVLQLSCWPTVVTMPAPEPHLSQGPSSLRALFPGSSPAGSLEHTLLEHAVLLVCFQVPCSPWPCDFIYNEINVLKDRALR